MAARTLTGRPARPARGFAYIALLASLTVLMLMLGMAAADIAQSAKREREAELLFVGRQYLHAIASYYERSPQANHQYPEKLEQLLQDDRFPKPVRHLRKIFVDPMTGSKEWGLLRNEQRRIVGVYSRSQEAPLKTSFEAELQQSFGDQPILSYADWKFVYRPTDGSADLANPDAGINDAEGGDDNVGEADAPQEDAPAE